MSPSLNIRYFWQRSKDNNENWYNIDGACYTTYQPSAFDVGCNLRVLVLEESKSENIDVLSNSFKSTSIGPIYADKDLFGAARKSLLDHGAHFSGLSGVASVSSRSFSILIERTDLNKSNNQSSLHTTTIYQKEGDTLVNVLPYTCFLYCALCVSNIYYTFIKIQIGEYVKSLNRRCTSRL